MRQGFWKVLALVAPLVASPKSSAELVPPTFFGMTFIRKEYATRENTGALGKGTLVAWPYIERIRGQYDWKNLDSWVKTAESLGVDFVYTFSSIPEWAASDPSRCKPSSIPAVKRCPVTPRDLGDYRRFVEALVERYRGRIGYYELWNEPEYDTSISVQDFVALTEIERKAIRAIDPAAKIISASLNARHSGWADKFFSSGGSKDLDIISLHTYPGSTTNFPESIDVHYTGISAIMSPLLPILKRHGLDQKPLWSTEGAWLDHGEIRTDKEEQAAFVARDLLIHWSSGFRRFYWYAYDHAAIGRLLGTPAGFAYELTKSWMLGASMSRACTADVTRPTIWTCELSREGKQSLVVWSVSGPQKFKAPSQYNSFVDENANRHAFVHELVINKRPILLTTAP